MRNMELRKQQKQKARQERLRQQKHIEANCGKVTHVILRYEDERWERHGAIRAGDDLELAKKNAEARLVAESGKSGSGVLHGERIVEVKTGKDVWMQQRRGPPAETKPEEAKTEQILPPGTKEPGTTA